MDEPMLRVFMQGAAPPLGAYEARSGRWVAEPSWPSPNVTPASFALTPSGGLVRGPTSGDDTAQTLRSPVFSGAAAGKWCSYAVPGDQPVDQRMDDIGNLVFETEPLTEAIEIIGSATLNLVVCADRPVAQIAVRLVDVASDGAATRVSFGVFNLNHHAGHATPESLVPGKFYDVSVPLKPVAQTFRAGHRIRLGLSSTYFPMIWPTPEPVTLTILAGQSALCLPIRHASPNEPDCSPSPEPESSEPAEIERIEPADGGWRLVRDLGSGEVAVEVKDGSGVYRLVDDDITVTKKCRERYSAIGDDLGSVKGWTQRHMGLSRDEWTTRTLTETTLTADPDAFRIEARLRAWEGDQLVHDESWDERIARDFC
jgi:hypothetical protein